MNAITYKEIFELIQHDKAWLGVNLGRGISGFIVPDYYARYGTEVSINDQGQTIIATNGCLWLTNLALAQRYKDILEVTEGRLIPDWLEANHETMTGTVKEIPTREQIDVPVNEVLIVELYSK